MALLEQGVKGDKLYKRSAWAVQSRNAVNI